MLLVSPPDVAHINVITAHFCRNVLELLAFATLVFFWTMKTNVEFIPEDTLKHILASDRSVKLTIACSLLLHM